MLTTEFSVWLDRAVYTAIAIVALVVVFGPVLWQIPKALWPPRLNRSATRFTGLYRRWKVDTITGRVSDHRSGTASRTVGGIDLHDSGSVISVSDRRHTFTTELDSFYLTDAAGATHPIRTANVSPSVGHGHLVSAAVLVHNGKPGYAFVVYNHTTGHYRTMQHYRRGIDVPPKGSFARMVFHLGKFHQLVAILCVGLGILLGILAHIQMATFNKIGVKPLLRLMEKRGAEQAAAEAERQPVAPAPTPIAAPPSPDIVEQIQRLVVLHSTGALSTEQFEAAKAKLLAEPQARGDLVGN
jgi:hypothetical protein